jgi:hypothetical protein
MLQTLLNKLWPRRRPDAPARVTLPRLSEDEHLLRAWRLWAVRAADDAFRRVGPRLRLPVAYHMFLGALVIPLGIEGAGDVELAVAREFARDPRRVAREAEKALDALAERLGREGAADAP